MPSAYGLPSINPNRFVDTGGDGRFEFPNVRAGSYIVRASYSALYSETKNIGVSDQPVEGVDFVLRAATLSGRILDESGSGLPDARVFPEVMVSTVSNPNLIASTIFPVANDGSFSRILEPEEYRFFVRVLPEEYSLKSITAGGVDLMKETLKFTGNEPVKVDVRVAKRTTSTDSSAASVKGRAIDALTGAPSVAERVTLCCRESGPVERFSTPVQADGSFEFSAIPRGLYTLGLQTRTGTPALFPVGRNIVVAPEGVSGLEVLSTPQFAELAVGLAIENVGRPSGNFSATVVFTSSNGRVRVEAAARGDFTYFASVPAGDRYTVSVTDLPEGYTVKSGVVSTDVPRTVSPSTGTQPVPAPPPTSIVTITLVRESR
jgi:hypothetical protein